MRSKNATKISGQIPKGYTRGWFALNNTFGEPKEETKS